MKCYVMAIIILFLTIEHGFCFHPATPWAIRGVTVCSGEAGDIDPKTK